LEMASLRVRRRSVRIFLAMVSAFCLDVAEKLSLGTAIAAIMPRNITIITSSARLKAVLFFAIIATKSVKINGDGRSVTVAIPVIKLSENRSGFSCNLLFLVVMGGCERCRQLCC